MNEGHLIHYGSGINALDAKLRHGSLTDYPAWCTTIRFAEFVSGRADLCDSNAELASADRLDAGEPDSEDVPVSVT